MEKEAMETRPGYCDGMGWDKEVKSMYLQAMGGTLQKPAAL